MTRIIEKTSLFLTLSGVAVLGLAVMASAPIQAAELEKCYGISKTGQDDGTKDTDIPGSSTVDFQGDAYKFVTKGTCVEISTPFGDGSLKPLDNRPPKGK